MDIFFICLRSVIDLISRDYIKGLPAEPDRRLHRTLYNRYNFEGLCDAVIITPAKALNI